LQNVLLQSIFESSQQAFSDLKMPIVPIVVQIKL